MRETVDEKLHATLEKRLGESFKTVSERLEQVHKGLGEMQTLAAGVGDLKKVLSNVKTRGTWGEISLGFLIEQLFTPEQYAKNVATKKGSSERVEFAIRLPGRDKDEGEVWLPIDSKFPKADYTRLIEAQEKGIFLSIENEYESAQKIVSAMEKRIEHQKNLVLDMNDRATQYSIMAREVDTNKVIYQSLLQRAKEIESMAGVSSGNIQIVNRADLPLLAVKPNVKLNLLLSIVLGLLGGIGCAFMAEYFADTVTHPSEISDRFQIPLLGTIP